MLSVIYFILTIVKIIQITNIQTILLIIYFTSLVISFKFLIETNKIIISSYSFSFMISSIPITNTIIALYFLFKLFKIRLNKDYD